MKVLLSSPRFRIPGIVSLVAISLGAAGCAEPVKMGKAPNIVIPIERKPPPGDAPPPHAPPEDERPLVHHAPDPAPARSAGQATLLSASEGARLRVFTGHRVI